MVKVRNTTIDFLRGLAVILMILIHATAYFLDQPTVRLMWDCAHFAVPLFVFCSVYIAFQKNNSKLPSVSRVFMRLKRLVIPYYIFTTILLLVFEFVLGTSITIQSATKWYLFGTGRDIGWLVVLFVYFIFLVPIIIKASKHDSLWKFLHRTIWITAFLFIYAPHLESFRLIMWLPWSAFLIFAFWFVKNEKKWWFPIYAITLSLIAFFVSRSILLEIGHTLVFTENKYPPNLYYLSYGILSTTLIYYFHRFLIEHNLFAHWLQKIFDFFSRHSYSLFFIHFLFVYILKEWMDYREIGAWGFFGAILFLSTLTQIGINQLA
ncbi:hypothetical protein CO051_03280, partial [Candidatus Roizmanbacteria bacterium CG_4_9_14_0_2_um_filter_39_13]